MLGGLRFRGQLVDRGLRLPCGGHGDDIQRDRTIARFHLPHVGDQRGGAIADLLRLGGAALQLFQIGAHVLMGLVDTQRFPGNIVRVRQQQQIARGDGALVDGILKTVDQHRTGIGLRQMRGKARIRVEQGSDGEYGNEQYHQRQR